MKIRKWTALLSVIIVILTFSKLRSEFAGFLIDISGNIFSVFAAAAIYTVYYAISRFIEKRSSYYEKELQFTATFVCLVLTFLSSFFINHYESPSLTTEELYAKQLKELKKMTKKGDKMLAENENTITDYFILKEDSIAIINYFNHFLDSAFYRNPDSLILDYSSTFGHFFNRNLTRHIYAELLTDTVSTNKYRQIIKNNLSIDFFSYSPDKRKLFIILTYEIGDEPTGANALAMIGERDNNRLILYRHSCGFRNDYSVVNKRYALYQAIIDFAEQRRPCGITNPLKKSFWNGEWFQKVDFNNMEKYRYQLDDYAYKWNEEKQYNERVTDEVKYFIATK